MAPRAQSGFWTQVGAMFACVGVISGFSISLFFNEPNVARFVFAGLWAVGAVLFFIDNLADLKGDSSLIPGGISLSSVRFRCTSR